MSKKNRKGKAGQQPAALDTLAERARDVWLAGLGALDRARQEGAEGFDALVAHGEQVRQKGGEAVETAFARLDGARDQVVASGKKARRKAKKAARKAERQVEEAVEALMRKAGLPTRAEVKALKKQVRTLEKRLARQRGAGSGPASFRLAPHDDGWAIERDGKAPNGQRYGTKKEALVAARRLAREHAPSRLIVLRADGSEQEAVEYTG